MLFVISETVLVIFGSNPCFVNSSSFLVFSGDFSFFSSFFFSAFILSLSFLAFSFSFSSSYFSFFFYFSVFASSKSSSSRPVIPLSCSVLSAFSRSLICFFKSLILVLVFLFLTTECDSSLRSSSSDFFFFS